jgi:hypothetical protein
VINQLKKVVLADNFKLNNDSGDLVEFMARCCYAVVSELVQQHQGVSAALKIDRSLAKELWQQAVLLAQLCASARSSADELESVNRRLKCSSAKYPFVIFEQMDSSNGDLDFEILSRLSAALVNAQIDSTRPCSASEAANAVVYRFCAKTGASFTLKSLLQSVMHQLCYLFEVHESYAFQVAFFCFYFKFHIFFNFIFLDN